jgi:hypothetical protein
VAHDKEEIPNRAEVIKEGTLPLRNAFGETPSSKSWGNTDLDFMGKRPGGADMNRHIGTMAFLLLILIQGEQAKTIPRPKNMQREM